MKTFRAEKTFMICFCFLNKEYFSVTELVVLDHRKILLDNDPQTKAKDRFKIRLWTADM